MNYILQRLREPSTYAGIGIALGAVDIDVPSGYLHSAALIGMAVSGLVTVVLKEGWHKALASGDAATAVETAVVTTQKG
jgi:hypothetical protein